MGRRKFTATELLDSRVYDIWERLHIVPAYELPEEERDDPQGIFDGLLANGLSIDDVDRSKVPEWVERLKFAERNLRVMRKQLEALQSDRVCPGCGDPVAGRADRVYCSGRCRTRAARSR